jgi:hypothetical protein
VQPITSYFLQAFKVRFYADSEGFETSHKVALYE